MINLNPIIRHDPDLIDILFELKRTIFLELNCHAIGTVQNFYPATQTADVTFNYKQVYFSRDNGSTTYFPVLKDYPVALSCPVVMLTGGNGVITMPIKQGDTCLLLFNDRDIDAWYASGQVNQEPTTSRMHNIADAVALVGIRHAKNAVQAYDADRITIKNKDAEVALSEEKIRIQNATKNLKDLLVGLSDALNAFATATSTAMVEPTLGPAATALSASISSLSSDLGALLE
jgi:hypothetical protein